MRVFENQFAYFDVFKEESLLILTWTSETTFMEVRDWKKTSLELVKKFETFKVSRLLANTKNFDFIITPDLQYWVGDQVFPASAANGLQKVAFIVAEDIFSATSLEQAMEEDKDNWFTASYFTNEGEARDWLFRTSITI